MKALQVILLLIGYGLLPADAISCRGVCWNQRFYTSQPEIPQRATTWCHEGNASWGTIEGFCRPDQLSERGHCEVTEFVPAMPERLMEPPSFSRSIVCHQGATIVGDECVYKVW